MIRFLSIAALLGALLTTPAVLAGEPLSATDGDETLHYQWSLGGFFGTVARVFFPGRGDGALTTCSGTDGTTNVELDITAPTATGEFWRYGAAIEAESGRTLKAWSSYKFRGRSDSKESELDEQAVIDIASGILLLRRDPPSEPRNLRIWNDGKIYPVVILPGETTVRRIGTRSFLVKHYAIRARRVPDERLWKGKLDIYLAADEVSTPVEISVERKMARVRLLIEVEDDES